VLDHARTFLDPKRMQAESLLNQIQKERDDLRKASVAAQDELVKAESLRRELQSRLASIQRQQEDLIERTRMELRREAEDVRHSLRRIVEDSKQTSNLSEARAAVNRLKQALSEPTWFPISATPQTTGGNGSAEAKPPPERPVQQGDIVEIKGLNVRAEVIAIRGDGTVDLKMGGVKVQLNRNQLRLAEGLTMPVAQAAPVSLKTAAPLEASSDVLDIRGVRAIEAYDLVTAFLDRCALAGPVRCRVIHGTGTGALREAVREALASSKQVSSFGPAPREEGGNGVTVIELA
jgi:DNA mismatch repair protein MutS2